MSYGMNNSRGNRGPAGSNMPKNYAGYDVTQMPNYTPQQMQLHEQGFQAVAPGSQTSRLAAGDPEMFNQLEAPAMRQFSEMQGQNASRFSGMGMGARRGSGFQNEMNQATSNFAQDLQSRRLELSRNAMKDLHSMSQDLLGNRPYENYYTEPKQSFWEKIAGGVLPVAGAAVGGYFAGPSGAMAGYQVGNAASNAFNR